MAVFSGSIYSDALKMDTTLHAVLTGDLRTERGCKPMLPGLKGKTLILLHGLSRNGAAWLYYVPLFRFAEQYGLRVILPDGHRSFYQDMTYGERYFTYIFEELPQLAHDLFGADISPENLMIAGLSMGGYGALRCAFTAPTHYAYAGAFLRQHNCVVLWRMMMRRIGIFCSGAYGVVRYRISDTGAK